MKMRQVALGVAAVVFGAGAQAFEEGSVLMRGRVIYVEPTGHSNSVGGLGTVKADGAATGELDFSYFFTPYFAAELILGTTSHDIHWDKGGLGGKVGEVSVLPPTLLFQYHPFSKGWFQPYVGVGLNYTYFYDVDSRYGDLSLDPSWGPAGQLGVDFVFKKFFINLDVKYIDMTTEASLKGNNGAWIDRKFDVDINPVIAGVGVGIKF